MEKIIQSTGFFRAKTTSLIALGQALCDRYGGEVPPRLKDLVTLPGVGRKTANVVLGNAFGVPGITVDTHFGRLARRFGWTTETDPVKIEFEVGALFPRSEWTMLSHRLIWHGRRVCHARRPACGACALARLCPSFGVGPVDPKSGQEAGQAGPLLVTETTPPGAPPWLRHAGRRRRADGGAAAAAAPGRRDRAAVGGPGARSGETAGAPDLLIVQRSPLAAPPRRPARLPRRRDRAGRSRPGRGRACARPPRRWASTRPGWRCLRCCPSCSSRAAVSGSPPCWPGGASPVRWSRPATARSTAAVRVRLADLADPANRLSVRHPSGARPARRSGCTACWSGASRRPWWTGCSRSAAGSSPGTPAARRTSPRTYSTPPPAARPPGRACRCAFPWSAGATYRPCATGADTCRAIPWVSAR